MATIRDLVRGAFRHLNVVSTGDEMPAENATDGLDNIKRLVAGWGLSLGTSDDTSAWALDTTFPLDAKFEDATTLLLAKRLASQYGGFQRLDLAELGRAERLIAAASTTINAVKVDSALQRMPSQYWGEPR